MPIEPLRKALLKTLVLFSILFSAQALAVQPLSVEDAWVRAAPPGASVTAGFMTLRNAGDRAVIITTVESPQFGRTEMHRSVHENGMMRMLPQKQLTVPAGGELKLAPGGYHLMLFDPRTTLKPGDAVTFILHTAAGSRIRATAQVRTGMGGMEHHHHDMH